MKKSFKRSIAVLLSVIMVACSMPFTALAAAGEYKPDIQLQFGTFWNASAGSPLNQENQYDYDYSLSGVYGPVVDYKNGALVLDADKYATWNESFSNEDIEESYTLTEGDIFTLTVRLDNVDKISAFEAAISYSDAIAPLDDEDWGVANGVEGTLNASLYEGLNDGLLGNLSFVDAEKNVIVASAAANQIDYADVSSTAVTGLTNPATGETDYDFAGKAVIATFVFQVVNAGPISFGIYNGTEDEDTTYGGAYYIADVNDGTDPEDYTTYEPADAVGQTDMTFMTKNEYVAPSGYTVKFVDAKGDTISEEVYDEGAAVTIPELPKTTNTTTQHTTYAWDVEPSATATADATYTIVATTVDHDYKSEVVTPATCDKKGSTKYTCKVCAYNFTVQDIAATGKHTPAKAVEENRVEATCSKAGSYDSVVYCNDCGTEISRTPVNIDKTAHNYGAYVYNKDAYRDADKVEHDGTETRTCGTCGATDTRTATGTGSLRATTYNLTLSAGVAVNFKTKKTTYDMFDKVYCVVKKWDAAKKAYETTDIEDNFLDGSNVAFRFTKIAPQCMADNMIVTFNAERDGVVYEGTIPFEISVRDYVMGQLNKQTTATSTAVLFVDMLNYGTAAQDYMKYNQTDYINSQLSATQKSWASDPITEYVDSQDSSYVVNANPQAKWRTAALRLESSVDFKLSFSDPNNGTTLTDISGLKIKVQLENGTVMWFNPVDNPENFEPYGTTGRWYFITSDIAVADLVSPVYFTICDLDGNAISNTFRYSAESYTMRQSGKDIKPTLDKMQQYAKSAYTYTVKGGK